MTSMNSAVSLALATLVAFVSQTSGAASPRPAEPQPVLEVTSNLTLDPGRAYGAIVIKKSGVTIDGQGAWLVGPGGPKTSAYKGTALTSDGFSDVHIRNLNAKGWETGLSARNGSGWTIERCDFSDNFHDPDFGWGENGKRGGIVLERVHKSRILHNKANRVWDACSLTDCHENQIEANDFSHTSNTCLKLWGSSRNTIRGNTLSHGIRIKPGEVHARDSTSVLIETGSNDNRFLNNDCTHGGDGIFIRVLNGWCSTGNVFEGNDCSYANNNGFECWAPRNVFVRNKANYCSYGFWLGGSDSTRLIENEASHNGQPGGNHNSPHLPGKGHAGIVFMFGSSSHTLARGNNCYDNNGAGIALVGDLDSNGKKWKAYHWVLEQNTLTGNRWGIYARHADWIVAAGNRYDHNAIKDVFLDGDVSRFSESSDAGEGGAEPPRPVLEGPGSVRVGAAGAWDASGSRDPRGLALRFTWDAGEGKLRAGARFEQAFDRVGLHRIGLNVSNGVFTEPAWRDVYAIREQRELGTEGTPQDWSIEDYEGGVRSSRQTSRAVFRSDAVEHLVGRSALGVRIDPYSGSRVLLTFPADRQARWPLAGKTRLCFWLRSRNADVTGWQGGPYVMIHGTDKSRCLLEPAPGRVPLRESPHSESRERWSYYEIPLAGDARWKREGTLPAAASAISLGFDSWGAPGLLLWIDGLALE